MNEEIAGFEKQLGEPGVWDNPEKARALSGELHKLKMRAEDLKRINSKFDDVQTLVELVRETDDAATLEEAKGEARALAALVEKTELKLFLSGKFDQNNAIVTIHAGQGGTESCDWAMMLYRMYQRYAEREGYTFKPLDILAGEVAGYKSCEFLVEGPYAYGYLKGEAGVHRLVRISPFDAAARRQTSFAPVDVSPEIDDVGDIEVNPADLRVDTFRSSGAGGQHVNKTDSAIRITHLPTNIVVSCQIERSQHSNRDTAMKMLKSKLAKLEQEKIDAEQAALKGEKKTGGFGAQIRSYVLAPYVLVKDHRTGHETGNATKVLDGDLQDFVSAYLLSQGDTQKK